MEVKSSTNYLHVEENSHFFDNLEQIKNYAEIQSKDEYLKIGIENTIKNGYILLKSESGKDNNKNLIEERVLYNVLKQIRENKEAIISAAPDKEYLSSLENIGMISMGWDNELTSFGYSMLEMLKNKLEK